MDNQCACIGVQEGGGAREWIMQPNSPKYQAEKVYTAFLYIIFKKNGYAPSVKEISTGTGLSSTSTVYNHLVMLEMLGKIEMKRNSPRAIKLVGYEYRKA